MKKESKITATTIQRELRSHWAVPGVLFSAPSRAACCYWFWQTGFCQSTALDQSRGKKRKNCLSVPQCLPNRLDQGSQQSSRYCLVLQSLLAEGQESFLGTRCSQHSRMPIRAPQTSSNRSSPRWVLPISQAGFLWARGAGVSAAETEASFHAWERRLSSSDPGRAIARGERAVQVACLIRIDLRSILWTKRGKTCNQKKRAEMAS